MLYFAAASTATGRTEETVSIPVASSTISQVTLKQLKEHLCAKYKETKLPAVLDGSQWSIDAEMVDEEKELGEVVLKGGEEVAVICPVSGG